jgi:hypothetical protein
MLNTPSKAASISAAKLVAESFAVDPVLKKYNKPSGSSCGTGLAEAINLYKPKLPVTLTSVPSVKADAKGKLPVAKAPAVEDILFNISLEVAGDQVEEALTTLDTSNELPPFIK